MPLKCLLDGAPLHAFDLDDASWRRLRDANRAQELLRMPCCGAGVVMKVSKLGTRYFAHARRGECVGAAESAEHLLAKEIIARAAEAAGWQVTTEAPGAAPGGGEWIADVLANRRQVNVALEVQLSPQSAEETARRQQRYGQSGVRGLWLFRQKQFPSGRCLPAFRLRFDAGTRRFDVEIPSPQAAAAPAPRVELGAFVRGALTGRLHWAPALRTPLPAEGWISETACWRCHGRTRIFQGLRVRADLAFAGHPPIDLRLRDLDASPDLLARLLAPAEWAAHGLAMPRRQWIPVEEQTCLSNLCSRCGAVLGRTLEMPYLADGERGFVTTVTLSDGWTAALPELAARFHWWWFAG